MVLLALVWHEVGRHDGLYHRNWIGQFTEQFRDGNLYPRWLSESFSGFGSPVFYFYPPLVYHIAGIVSLLGITDEVVLFKIVAYLFIVLSFFTCRAYLKRITTNSLAIVVGSFLYAVAPYRVIDLYIRSAWTEYVALTWLPLIFIICEQLIVEQRRDETIRSTIYLAGLIALMILTNIPAAIIVVPAAGLYMLVASPLRHYVKIIGATFVASFLGFLFAGIFTFPLLAFREFLSEEKLWRFFPTHVGYTFASAFTPSNRIFGFSILAVMLLALGVLVLLIRHRRRTQRGAERKRILAFIVLCVALVFLQLPVSEPIYYIPPLRHIQLAFRWDIVLTLVCSAAIASIFLRSRKTALMLGTAMLVTSVVIVMIVELRYPPVNDKERRRFLERDDPAEYLSVTASHEAEIVEPYYQSKSKREHDSVSGFAKGMPSITRLERTPELHRYTVSAQDTGTVAINLNHFPTWEVFRNDTPIASKGDEYGRRVIPIAKGDYEVTVVRHSSTAEQYGLLATGIGLLSVLVAYLSGKKKLRGSSQT